MKILYLLIGLFLWTAFVDAVPHKFGPIDVNGQADFSNIPIINVGTPVNDTDAATKAYVDSVGFSGEENITMEEDAYVRLVEPIMLSTGNSWSELKGVVDAYVTDNGTAYNAFWSNNTLLYASGDHSTDAIQEAIDAVDNGRIDLCSGTFTGSIDMADKAVIVNGVSMNHTIIYGDGASIIVDMENSASFPEDRNWPRDGQVLQNVQVLNDNSGTGIVLKFEPFYSTSLKNVYVKDCDIGVNFKNGHRKAQNLYLDGNDLYGIYSYTDDESGWGAALECEGGEWGNYGDYGVYLVGLARLQMTRVICEGHEISEIKAATDSATTHVPKVEAYECYFERWAGTGKFFNFTDNSTSDNLVGPHNNKLISCLFSTQLDLESLYFDNSNGNTIEDNTFACDDGDTWTVELKSRNTSVKRNLMDRDWATYFRVNGTTENWNLLYNDISGNPSFRTENSGSATITSGGTSVFIDLGLDLPDSAVNQKKFRIYPAEDPNKRWWLDWVSDGVWLNVDSDPGEDITFYWYYG